MLKSMTGYGKATCLYKNKAVTIELRAVNSKQLDISTRMPGFYKEKDIEMRNEISRVCERGKIDLLLNVEQTEISEQLQINTPVVKAYFSQIKNLAIEMNVPVSEQLLLSVLRMPDTMKANQPTLDDEESNALMTCLKDALSAFTAFRQQEGQALAGDIIDRVKLVESLLIEIEPFEKGRIEKVRERLQRNLSEFVPAESIDANRFEQEIIYFLEKLDITEEKVRLRNHCSYFVETIKESNSPGRKLGFIAQEMGREINTIGSKANDSDIQKYVVQMKDELEKIKEQLLNVL